jgi:hypothetical protein
VWERTGTLSAADATVDTVRAPFPALEPGLWRIQARTDAFSNDAAATRLLFVHPGGVTTEAALRELVSRMGEDESLVGTADPQTAAAYALALAELDVLPRSPPISGRLQADFGIDERRMSLRWLAAAAFALCGLFVALVIARRGVDATLEARRVLVAAGEAPSDVTRASRRNALTVGLFVITILLCFLAGGMLLLARGAWL